MTNSLCKHENTIDLYAKAKRKDFTKCLDCDKIVTWGYHLKKSGQASKVTRSNDAAGYTYTPSGTGGTLDNVIEQDTPEQPARPAFTPSKFQLDFYNAIKNTSDNIALMAGPGTGKTTTFRNVVPYLPQGAKVVAIAFGKKQGDDLQAAFDSAGAGSWIKGKTTHSLALSNYKKVYKYAQVDKDDNKIWDLIDEAGDYSERDAIKAVGATIKQLVGLCKNTLTQPTPEGLERLTSYYGIETNESAELIYRITKEVFDASLENTSLVSFDDMLYFCAMKLVPCEKFDFILTDETQDFNEAQIQLVKNSCHATTRILSVGDELQSMYGFRGADADAFQKMIDAFDMKKMPLSISYRLPTSHVDYINARFPQAQLLARDNAPVGLVGDIAISQLSEKVERGDMVICRVNAPLVKPCFELIRRGIKATIVGRNIGDNLITMLKKMGKRVKSDDLEKVLPEMESYTVKEVAKLLQRRKENQAMSLQDTCDTLIALAEDCKVISDVVAKIDDVFSDSVQGVVFSSVHRAKGLEAKRVIILHPEKMPHPMAKQDWQVKQEYNCLFVAISRSKDEMWFAHESMGLLN